LTANATLPLFVAQQPNFAPVITVQPEGRTVPARSDVTFAVVAAGTGPLAYQWQSNGMALAGATSATLTLTGVTTNHAASYRAVITNAIGAVTSAPAPLVVNRLAPGLAWPPPAPIVYGTPLGAGQLNATNLATGSLSYTPPPGTNLPAGSHALQVSFVATDQATYSNETRTVSVQVLRALLTIRAEDKTRAFGLANPPLTVIYTGFVNGETNTVLSAQPNPSSTADASSAPGRYPIVVSGATATNYDITNAAGWLTVTSTVPLITQQPTNFTAVVSSNATFAVTATGTAPLTYQWRFGGTNLPGATNATLNLTNVQPASAGAYNVQVSNPGGTTVSDPALLTVVVPPSMVAQPASQTVGERSSVAFGVIVAGTAPFSYQWQLAGTNLPGATAPVLTVPNVGLPHQGTYRVIVSNAAGTVQSSPATLTVLASPTNSPPVLGVITNRTVDEGLNLTFTIRATDSDQPAQTLTYSLAGAPSGATVNPTSGVFTWTPSEAQGPSTNTITVLVTDNGTPPMVAVTNFSVEVREVNTAPAMSLTNVTVTEGTTLVLSGYATDPDLPPNNLTYEMLSVAPSGLAFNPANGVVTWTPSEAQGPGSYPLTIRVVDNGTPSLSATQTITVFVTESNSPPLFGPIPNQTVYQGDFVLIPLQAVDNDLPANLLTFSLLSAPTNAFLTNNTFVWRPTAGQVDAAHPVTVKVSDNGLPSMSSTQAFQITVNRLAQLSAQSLGGNQLKVGVTGRANVVYTLQSSSDLGAWQTVLVTNSATAAFEWIEATSPATRRFYRILEQRQF
jgi:hypothetical protein